MGLITSMLHILRWVQACLTVEQAHLYKIMKAIIQRPRPHSAYFSPYFNCNAGIWKIWSLHCFPRYPDFLIHIRIDRHINIHTHTNTHTHTHTQKCLHSHVANHALAHTCKTPAQCKYSKLNVYNKKCHTSTTFNASIRFHS